MQRRTPVNERSPAATRALEALALRWALPEGAVVRLERLLAALVRDPHAPTSVSGADEAVDVHIADSLTGLQVPELREAERIVDIGSGAGLPGLVLAIALPDSDFDLLEASRRKCAFIEAAIGDLGLGNARALASRAETWGADAAAGAGIYGAALARAVGPLSVLIEYAAPLLVLGGVLVAWRGHRDPEAERRGADAAGMLGMRVERVEPVEAYAGSRNRHLHVVRKTGPCPPGYPRRPGMARKRPLG
jgi:16S rRNA (guanine527-N7)-methyltransferase